MTLPFTRRVTYRLTALLLAVFTLAIPGLAQDQTLWLSGSPDFSTDDRTFARTDTLYLRAELPGIDYTSLDKNEFRLKPDEGGNDLFARLHNNLDGTFILALGLDQTDVSEADWEVRLRLADRYGFNFERRIDITVGRDSNGSGDDTNDELELKGYIDALSDSSIVVGGVGFAVDGATVVLDDDNNPMPYANLSVGTFVEIRADRVRNDVWLADRIKLEDDFDVNDEIEFTGLIESITPDSIVVSGTVKSLKTCFS